MKTTTNHQGYSMTEEIVTLGNKPQEVTQSKQAPQESTIKELEYTPEPRICIFTGEQGTHQRLVNGQIVWLSESMHNIKTTGEIAEQLRRLNEEKQTNKETNVVNEKVVKKNKGRIKRRKKNAKKISSKESVQKV